MPAPQHPTSSSPPWSPRSCQLPAHPLPSANLPSPNLARPGRLQLSQMLETSPQSPPPSGTGCHQEHSHAWGRGHPWGHGCHRGQCVGDVVLTDRARGAGPGSVAPVSSRPVRTCLQTNAGRSHTHTHMHRSASFLGAHSLPRSPFVMQMPSPGASPRVLESCGLSRVGPEVKTPWVLQPTPLHGELSWRLAEEPQLQTQTGLRFDRSAASVPRAGVAATPLEAPGFEAPPSLLELPWVERPGFTVLSCPPPPNGGGGYSPPPPQPSLMGCRPAVPHACPSRAQIWGPGLGGAPCWGRSASGSSCHLQPGWPGRETRAE